MDIVSKLNRELLEQDFLKEQPASDELFRYKEIARHYASMEKSIAVLSDMRTNTSYIYYGGFSKILGIEHADREGVVYSIWEESILKLIHPDDLHSKYLQELRFFHFMKRQPVGKRFDYYLMNKLRMKNAAGNYLPVLHRLYYMAMLPGSNNLWLALCLYNPLLFDISGKGVVVNAVTGQMNELESNQDSGILSEREKQILRLIDQGMMSRDIAETLCISIHTVSRHRQEILGKLQVRNSIEACRIARDLKIIL